MSPKLISDYFKPLNINYGFLTKNIANSSHQYITPKGDDSLATLSVIKQNHKLALQHFSSQSSKINIARQVHGNKAMVLTEDITFLHEPSADALVTAKKNLIIGVVTADCVPIFLVDYINEVIAVVHAGWRGAKSGIVQSTINKMYDLGANQIVAVIGPSIKQNNYEVGKEFYDKFCYNNPGNQKFFINYINKFKFDLTRYVKTKLGALHIKTIYDLNIDTFARADICFSHRRNTLNNIDTKHLLISLITIV